MATAAVGAATMMTMGMTWIIELTREGEWSVRGQTAVSSYLKILSRVERVWMCERTDADGPDQDVDCRVAQDTLTTVTTQM